jgi:hypothetical protein
MFGTFKIISITAALAAGVVTAYDMPQVRAGSETAGKTYYDRILPSEPATATKVAYAVAMPEHTGSIKSDVKADSLRTLDPNCASQAWPNISRECLVAETGTPVRKAARTITIEKREGANTSILVRVPSAEIASR